MSLDKGILAKIDNRLRSELGVGPNTQMAKIPISDTQWSVWKRYCDMISISIGGGIAILIDHELGSVVEAEVETLTDSVNAREAAVAEREAQVADRENAVGKRERWLDFRERQIKSREQQLDSQRRQLDALEATLELANAAARPRTPVRTQPTPGRNDPCWCGSDKKYKVCHLRSPTR